MMSDRCFRSVSGTTASLVRIAAVVVGAAYVALSLGILGGRYFDTTASPLGVTVLILGPSLGLLFLTIWRPRVPRLAAFAVSCAVGLWMLWPIGAAMADGTCNHSLGGGGIGLYDGLCPSAILVVPMVQCGIFVGGELIARYGPDLARKAPERFRIVGFVGAVIVFVVAAQYAGRYLVVSSSGTYECTVTEESLRRWSYLEGFGREFEVGEVRSGTYGCLAGETCSELTVGLLGTRSSRCPSSIQR